MKTELTNKIEKRLSEESEASKNLLTLFEYTIRTSSCNIRYDGMSLNRPENKLTGYEIKVSESDFDNLRRKLQDQRNYMDYCDEFYVVVPIELKNFALSRLSEWNFDKYVGIKVYDENMNMIKTFKKMNSHWDEIDWGYKKEKMLEIFKNKVIDEVAREK